jgi:hypothetical protein
VASLSSLPACRVVPSSLRQVIREEHENNGVPIASQPLKRWFNIVQLCNISSPVGDFLFIKKRILKEKKKTEQYLSYSGGFTGGQKIAYTDLNFTFKHEYF